MLPVWPVRWTSCSSARFLRNIYFAPNCSQAQDTEGYKKLLDAEKDSRKRFLLDKIDERIAIMDTLIETHQQEEKAAEVEREKAVAKVRDLEASQDKTEAFKRDLFFSFLRKRP